MDNAVGVSVLSINFRITDKDFHIDENPATS